MKIIQELRRKYYTNLPTGSLSYNWKTLLSKYINKYSVTLEIGSGPQNKNTMLLWQLSGILIGIDVDYKIMENNYLHGRYLYNGETFPFNDNLFDVVCCHAVMEHIKDPPLMLNEIKRTLKPGGFFISAQPNILSPSVFLSNIVPEYFKENVYKAATANTIVRDLYRTYYKFNSINRCFKFLNSCGFLIIEANTQEGPPLYHFGNPLLYFLQTSYERLLNSQPLMSNFRNLLRIVAQKPFQE